MRLEGLSVRWETTILPLKGGKNKANQNKQQYLNEAQAIIENSKKIVQAKKSIRRMPWHREPSKDVTNCDKLRGAVNKHRSADFRIGKPP